MVSKPVRVSLGYPPTPPTRRVFRLLCRSRSRPHGLLGGGTDGQPLSVADPGCAGRRGPQILSPPWPPGLRATDPGGTVTPSQAAVRTRHDGSPLLLRERSMQPVPLGPWISRGVVCLLVLRAISSRGREEGQNAGRSGVYPTDVIGQARSDGRLWSTA